MERSVSPSVFPSPTSALDLSGRTGSSDAVTVASRTSEQRRSRRASMVSSSPSVPQSPTGRSTPTTTTARASSPPARSRSPTTKSGKRQSFHPAAVRAPLLQAADGSPSPRHHHDTHSSSTSIPTPTIDEFRSKLNSMMQRFEFPVVDFEREKDRQRRLRRQERENERRKVAAAEEVKVAVEQERMLSTFRRSPFELHRDQQQQQRKVSAPRRTFSPSATAGTTTTGHATSQQRRRGSLVVAAGPEGGARTSPLSDPRRLSTSGLEAPASPLTLDSTQRFVDTVKPTVAAPSTTNKNDKNVLRDLNDVVIPLDLISNDGSEKERRRQRQVNSTEESKTTLAPTGATTRRPLSPTSLQRIYASADLLEQPDRLLDPVTPIETSFLCSAVHEDFTPEELSDECFNCRCESSSAAQYTPRQRRAAERSFLQAAGATDELAAHDGIEALCSPSGSPTPMTLHQRQQWYREFVQKRQSEQKSWTTTAPPAATSRNGISPPSNSGKAIPADSTTISSTAAADRTPTTTTTPRRRRCSTTQVAVLHNRITRSPGRSDLVDPLVVAPSSRHPSRTSDIRPTLVAAKKGPLGASSSSPATPRGTRATVGTGTPAGSPRTPTPARRKPAFPLAGGDTTVSSPSPTPQLKTPRRGSVSATSTSRPTPAPVPTASTSPPPAVHHHGTGNIPTRRIAGTFQVSV